MMVNNINYELIKYIKDNIFPIYETFDNGHNVKHIISVIDRSIALAKTISNLDMNIVYAAAALHDIGIRESRDNHAYHSYNFVTKNENLKNFFSEEEILVIAEAVIDHSTSKGIEPRSIYGKIICDADKDDNIDESLLRALEFTEFYFPLYSKKECYRNVFVQLNKKYGTDGKVIFWINNEQQKKFLKQMKELANNEEVFMKKIIKLDISRIQKDV